MSEQGAVAAEPPKKSRFTLPSAYTILFALIVLAAIATWVIPAGTYNLNAQGEPIPGTYHEVDAKRDALVMCSATVLALVGNEIGAVVFGDEAAVFVAAIGIGVVGGLAGVALRRTPLVFIVPGVLMLVPGSAGFNSALQLLTDQTVTGINTAFDTFVTAMSIAYGLMVSTIVLPRRFTNLAARHG